MISLNNFSLRLNRIIILSFLLTAQLTFAQTTINFTDFFREQINQLNEISIAEVGSATFRASWLDEIEIRTRSRDFEFQKQRYTLRLTPTSSKIRKAQYAIFDGLKDDLLLERTKYFHDHIEFIYKEWLNIYEDHSKLAIHDSLLLVYEDIESVLLKMALSSDFKTKDLIDIQSDITETKIAIQTLRSKLTNSLNSISPQFQDLIPIDSIEQWLLIQSITGNSNKKLELEKNVKEANIEAEMALEKAESQRIFDFFQIEYEGPHDQVIEERISIGLGLKLPLSSDSHLKMEELRLEQEILKEKLAVDQVLLKKKLNRKNQILLSSLNEYHLHETLMKTQNEKTNALIKKLGREEGFTPLLQLYHMVSQQKQSFNSLDLELNIYSNYIEYLVLTEQLFEQPIQNFLTDIIIN